MAHATRVGGRRRLTLVTRITRDNGVASEETASDDLAWPWCAPDPVSRATPRKYRTAAPTPTPGRSRALASTRTLTSTRTRTPACAPSPTARKIVIPQSHSTALRHQ
jgi:hypothetical protein